MSPPPAPGHEHAVPARAALPRGCRPRATFVVRGRVVAVGAQSLAVGVATANRAARSYRGKRVSLLLHRGTKTAGAAPAAVGDTVTVSAGRCKAKGRRLIAVRVGVTRKAATPAATPPTGTVLELVADRAGMPKFDKARLEAPAGRVTLRLTNPSPIAHNIAIQGHGAGKVVGKGGTSTVTADLKAGSYTYLCHVTGHAAAGMKGTLVVR